MDRMAKEKAELDKERVQGQINFFKSTSVKNEIIVKKAEAEIKKAQAEIAEIESKVETKLGRLVSIIDDVWKEGVSIPNLALTKQQVVEVIYTRELNKTIARTLTMLLSRMESKATFNGLAIGLRLAFRGYQMDHNIQQPGQGPGQ